MLASITDQLVEFLNTDQDISWTDYNCPDFVTAAPALDPSMIFEQGKAGLWISPVVVNYNLAQASKREKIKVLLGSPVVAIVISIPFSSFETGDVGTWEEIKKILNFREDVDKALLTHQWAYQITDALPEPPQEIQLNQRWFLTVTEITFEE